jgi:hypothetical protein
MDRMEGADLIDCEVVDGMLAEDEAVARFERSDRLLERGAEVGAELPADELAFGVDFREERFEEPAVVDELVAASLGEHAHRLADGHDAQPRAQLSAAAVARNTGGIADKHFDAETLEDLVDVGRCSTERCHRGPDGFERLLEVRERTGLALHARQGKMQVGGMGSRDDRWVWGAKARGNPAYEWGGNNGCVGPGLRSAQKVG